MLIIDWILNISKRELRLLLSQMQLSAKELLFLYSYYNLLFLQPQSLGIAYLELFQKLGLLQIFW